ncbi:MAG: hypothetical protein IKK07_04900 [Bacteroides sp.]|nr:hypothetical protein [Bacteroides sp.]
MKKIFFALAALVLAFTGCSQEEDAIQVSEKKAVKVVVNMDKPGFGEDTRAARTRWEEGDEVAVLLGNDLEHLILLTYDGTGWGVMVTYLDIDIFRPMTGLAQNQYLADLTSGNLKAIYCSSGIYGAKPYPDDAETVEDLEAIEIISYARNNGDYNADLDFVPNPLGECVMTCEEGGTYTKIDGELTLNIEMEPRVAQFTIKDLSDNEEGKTSQDYEVGVAGGNLVAYAGGYIMPDGIMLRQVYTAGFYNACWVHPNADGISIYASPYAGLSEFADYDTYIFSVGDYIREFNCNDYKDRIYNGAAIIMDGPTDAAIDAGKWYTPA